MSQRTRYILIISALAVVIGVGGGLVYYFSTQTQIGTAVGVRTDDDGIIMVDKEALLAAVGEGTAGRSRNLQGDNDIDWLATPCTRSHDPSQPSAYDAPAGTGFDIDYTCTITDTSTAHTLEVRRFDFQAYVFKIPTEACRDQSTKAALAQGATWPPAINPANFPPPPTPPVPLNYGALGNWISHWQWTATTNNLTCADLNVPPPPPLAGFPAFENIQEVGWPDAPTPSTPANEATQIIQIPAGQATVSFTTKHNFPTCGWWQYDDLAVDTATQDRVVIMGAPRRASGTYGSANCPTVGGNLGNAEIRVWNEVDGNGEYSTSGTTGGKDTSIPGHPIKLTNSTGADVTTSLCGAAVTGGAGRLACSQIPVGKYTAVITTPTTASGPLMKDSNANPSPGEQHNATPSLTLTLTVVAAPQPTGQPSDVVTYFDYGFGAQLGNLTVKIWEEKDQLPVSAATEYSTPSAIPAGTDLPFAFKPVKVFQGSTDVTAQLCDSGRTTTGGAGRLDCWQIPIGVYRVQVSNPDSTKFTGPLKDTHANEKAGEFHNALGVENLTNTVIPGPQPTGVGNDIVTVYDFGYVAKAGPIVQSAACTIDKSVTDTTVGDEESPDDPKKSNSSKGETLTFTIKYNCPDNPLGDGAGGGITASPIILITDDYDEVNTTVDATSISTGGNHDTAQKLITWNVTDKGPTGTVTFRATVSNSLAAGTYTSINKVQITRVNAVDDQDQTTTTIKIAQVSVLPPAPNNTPTPVPPPVNNGGVIPPETGVGAQAIILILSALAAILVTGLSLRFKFGKN